MAITDKLSGIRALCIGDVMLDRFISGKVKRISPESPVPVLSVSNAQSVPGGAANVARNMASLGGLCTLVSVIGEDAVGRELRAAVDRVPGLRCEFCIDPQRPTSEKTRFVAQGQHMLRTDVESASEVDAATAQALIDKIEKLSAGHDVLVLSDYAKGTLTDAVIRTAIRVAESMAIPIVVDPKSVHLSRYAGATVITPNSKEVLDATGIDPTEVDADAETACQSILQQSGVQHVLLTRGHRGMTLVGRELEPLHIQASAREVFDVVGAGDTVMATLALALGARLELTEAARLSNLAAGIVVGKRGTATVTQTELADEMRRVAAGSLRGLQDKILTLAEAVQATQTWKKNGFSVGFTNGCFDILHVGHLSTLNFARQHCGKLIVAVNTDASVRRLKEAGRPVNSEQDRCMVLAGLTAVDAVVMFDEDTPLVLVMQIDPDMLVKGGDYTVDSIVGAAHVLAQGGRVLTCPLVPGKSTSHVVGAVRRGGGR